MSNLISVKRYLAIILAASLIMCGISIPIKAQAAVPIQSININNEDVQLSPNQSFQLNYTVFPNNASNQRLNWKSENTNIVSVSSNGTLTARASGVTNISCTTTDGSNLKSTKAIEVIQLAQSVSINENQITIYTGQSVSLNYSFTPSSTTSKRLTWQSKNNSIASINDGVVHGTQRGTTEISCSTTDGSNKRDSCSVTVLQSVTEISLNKTQVTLNVGESMQLVASIKPTNANNKAVTWNSESGAVTVDNNGKIYAVALGSATITCSSTDNSGISKSVSVRITDNNYDVPSSNEPVTKPKSPSKTETTTFPDESFNEEVTEQHLLTDEEIETMFDSVFFEDEDNNLDDGIENDKKIDELINLTGTLTEEKTIQLNWNNIENFAGCEVWASIGDEYQLVARGNMSEYIKNNYLFKTQYSYKIRTYVFNVNKKKVYSEYTTPLEVLTPSKGFFNVIKDFFTSIFN